MSAPTTRATAAAPGSRLPRLAPTLPVLLRRCGDVQLGWDPDRAVLVRPPDPRTAGAVAALLRSVDGVHTPQALAARAAAAGFAPGELGALLEELAAAGVLTWVAPLGSAVPGFVGLHGAGPLADALVDGLAHVGTTVVRTSGRESPVGENAPAPDVVVLADDLVVDPCVVSELVATRTPHLHVRLRDGTGVVGPLVLPGRSSCLRCADLHRSDADDEWPAVAAQLLGRTGHAPVATVRATAALAQAQVEQLLRGPGAGPEAPAALDATLELDTGRAVLTRRGWSPHARCGCGAYP